MEPEFESIQNQAPSASRVSEIQRLLTVGLTPARPIASSSTLLAICAAGYVALAVVLAAVFGFAGWKSLSMAKMLVEYSTVFVSVLLAGSALVELMVPGSRQRVSASVSVLFPLVALSIVIPWIFPDTSTANFVHRGIPCLRLGILCAVPAAALGAWFLRRGYVTDPLPAAITLGSLAGLLGVGVLALHCPIQNAAHIMACHIGALVIAISAGAITGWLFTRPRPAR